MECHTERKKHLWNKAAGFAFVAAIMFFIFSAAAPQKISAADKLTLNKQGKSSVTISDTKCYAMTKQPNYIKFKSGVTGYITVTITDASKRVKPLGYLTFCNSRKKALGRNKEFFSTKKKKSETRFFTRTYGVKKGGTYYIKIQSSGGVKVASSVTAVKTNSCKAASYAKAKKALDRNKSISGVLIAGDKAVHWYKINLAKSQKVNIFYSAKTNGAILAKDGIYYNNGIKFTFCINTGKPFAAGNYDMATCLRPSDKVTYYYKGSTGTEYGLDKGTYYIKVERYNKTSSGFYTIKWN